MKAIIDAANNTDIPALQMLVSKAGELVTMRDQQEAINRRLAGFQPAATEPATSGVGTTTTNGLRELAIFVSRGMREQFLLTLTDHIKQKRVDVDEIWTIEPQPKGRRFTSKVIRSGKKLQARGPIRRFYEDAEVDAGDYVVLVETAPMQFQLRKASPGKYGPIRPSLEQVLEKFDV